MYAGGNLTKLSNIDIMLGHLADKATYIFLVI